MLFYLSASVSGVIIFFMLTLVPTIKPAKPISPIKLFLKIMNDFSYPIVVFHRAVVCKSAGKSNPSVDKDKAPKSIERIDIKVTCEDLILRLTRLTKFNYLPTSEMKCSKFGISTAIRTTIKRS